MTSRGIRKQPIFGDATDRRFWLETLETVVSKYGWICHSFCQMTNHFHLSIETPNADIAAGMHRLNSEHAHWFNWRWGFSGHVFEARYHDELIETESHFVAVARYIALNPVRAGICANAEDWPWSSYAGTVGEALPSPCVSDTRVLAHFDDDAARARGLFRASVDAGAREVAGAATAVRDMAVPGTDMLRRVMSA